jgi:DNA-binding NarL/FixJ family response regulator
MINTTSHTILVIDDEELVRQSMTDYLIDYGYRVLTAENGRVGIELFEKTGADLVLVDLRMPEMDGLEVLSHISRTSPQTPLVVVSMTNVISDAVEALHRGAWDFLLKPVKEAAILVHTVENALEKARLRQENSRYQTHLEQMVAERAEELQIANAELRKREQELQDLNGALRVLLKQRDEDRKSVEENILSSVQKIVKPGLDRLKSGCRRNVRQIREVEALQECLDNLVSPFAKQMSSDFFGLTPAEIQVAVLIRQGLATKEIAEALNLSTNTIITHRYKIRTKLGLVGAKQSLFAFLNELRQ